MRRQRLAQEAEPRGVEAMKRRHGSLGIPPAFGERREALDFVGIDAGRRRIHREFLGPIRMFPKLASLPPARVCMGALWGAIRPLMTSLHPRGLDG